MDEDKLFYLMLRGVLRFQATYSTYPGALLEHEPDITRLKVVCKSFTCKMLDTAAGLVIKLFVLSYLVTDEFAGQ